MQLIQLRADLKETPGFLWFNRMKTYKEDLFSVFNSSVWKYSYVKEMKSMEIRVQLIWRKRFSAYKDSNSEVCAGISIFKRTVYRFGGY